MHENDLLSRVKTEQGTIVYRESMSEASKTKTLVVAHAYVNGMVSYLLSNFLICLLVTLARRHMFSGVF